MNRIQYYWLAFRMIVFSMIIVFVIGTLIGLWIITIPGIIVSSYWYICHRKELKDMGYI
jgi:hypothetical protein